MMYDEYVDRVTEVVTGIVQQAGDRNNVLVDLGRVEALLPRSEQVDGERYEQGSRIKAVITEVRSGTKGPQVILSRRDPELIRTLFELEVPEIADGLVEIRGVAREPGYRSKIAVESHAQGVDPVGACVGPRGSRVRMVVSELRGEKIDIIPWNTEPARYVAKALSPARVREVYIDDDAKEATVIVPDDQLALAIGKEGLNARLAARLTGWKVDIQSETEFAQRGGRRCLRRRGRPGVHRPLRRDPLQRQALPERGAAGLPLLRRPGAPGARARASPARARSSRSPRPEPEAAEEAERRSSAVETDDAAEAEPLPERGGRAAAASGEDGAADVRRDAHRSAAASGADGRLRRRSSSASQRATDELIEGKGVPGRGAYTCKRLACFERARTRTGFARVLRRTVKSSRRSAPFTLTEGYGEQGPNRPNRPIRPRGVGARRAASAASSSTTRRTAAAPARRASAHARDDRPPKGDRAPVAAADRSRHGRLGRQRQGSLRGDRLPVAQIIKFMMGLGEMVTITQSLSDEAVELLAAEAGREIDIRHAADEEDRPGVLRGRRGAISRRGRRS